MLVKMTTCLSGPRCCLGPGDQHDFPQDEAMRLIRAGFAVPVVEQEIETTSQAAPPERRRGRRKDT